MAEITTFDFILLLIISEATSNALAGGDVSVTNAMIVMSTLVGLDIALSLLKQWAPKVERWMEGLPLILVENGRPLHDIMKRARVDHEDVLEAARRLQGLERIDQIRYAVLEKTGGISIIPIRS